MNEHAVAAHSKGDGYRVIAPLVVHAYVRNGRHARQEMAVARALCQRKLGKMESAIAFLLSRSKRAPSDVDILHRGEVVDADGARHGLRRWEVADVDRARHRLGRGEIVDADGPRHWLGRREVADV